MRQVYSLNHTRWECKYHIVFIPKYSLLGSSFGQEDILHRRLVEMNKLSESTFAIRKRKIAESINWH